MADWFLILAICVAIAILLIVAFYLLVKYSHPDDKWDAWGPKFVVIFGFVLAGGTVLLLPLDVANNEGYAGCDGFDTAFCGGLNMELFWDIIYWCIPIWIFVLIPFSTFYYEADDGTLMQGTRIGIKPNSRICEAIKYEIAVLIIAGLAMGLCYLFLSDTAIPVREYNGTDIRETVAAQAIYEVLPRYNEYQNETLPFQTNQLEDMTNFDKVVLAGTEEGEDMDTIVIQVNPSTFFAGFMAFIGWFFFAIFGGVGIASMPLDLILGFINRPRHMDAVEFAEAQMSIRERVNELVDIGELLKIEADAKANEEGGGGKGWFNRQARRDANEERKTLLQFKQAVYLLEKDVEDFQACSANYANYNPLIPWFSLFFGIISLLVSIVWIIHIILYILPRGNPINPFLNTYFRWFDNWFPLFGVLSVAIFSVYLLLCALKGCFKFGLRFFWFTLHPMKLNRTYMSSFMFNIGLVLLCALPVVQFCTTAFADYARYATVRQVFGTQIEYLQFFRYFWTNNVFVYVLLVMACLSAIYLACKPRDTSTSSIELRDRLKSRRG